MFKISLIILLVNIYTLCLGQQNDKISTMDFVQILDNNDEEAIYYYQNNWENLRKLALEKDYIESYNIYLTDSQDSLFNIILVTTYKNIELYNSREDNFNELINMRGDLKLLNDKIPTEFRKTVFSRSIVRHLNEENISN